MPRRHIRISVALKIRLLFGVAVACTIVAALIVPWYFMEILGEQGIEAPARELMQLRLDEWAMRHPESLVDAGDSHSWVFDLYTRRHQAEGLRGPAMIRLNHEDASQDLDGPALRAMQSFDSNPNLDVVWRRTRDERDEVVYRCFRAVRNTQSCNDCHGERTQPGTARFQLDQLVGLIDITLPASFARGDLLWWTRGAFLAGGALAGCVALLVFAWLSNRIVLRPVRKLRELVDHVAEGDLTARSSLTTADEFQRLGESFNEMLEAISSQHSRLQNANTALDFKLNELGEVNVALYEANQMKTEFLGNVSHELRTPLNSIIGFSDLLAEADDDKVSRYGRNISMASKNLLAMINDMLDLARMEAGKASVRIDKVAIGDICQNLLALMQPLADKKSITLTSDVGTELPLATTDGGKVRQILFNLMSNAVKFTPPEGDVKLTVELETTTAQPQLHIAVSDTGPGISADDQAHIFEKFYQVEGALTKEAQGTGLGLAISRELTQLLGGRLTVRSETGHGTTFAAILPLHHEQAELPDGIPAS